MTNTPEPVVVDTLRNVRYFLSRLELSLKGVES
jgi:hypothetical protein